MNKYKSRARLVAGSGAAACVLLASSNAYACTIYRGQMTVTVTPGFGVSKVVGSGTPTKNLNHRYCSTAQNVIATADTAVAQQVNAPIEATIRMAPAVCGLEVSQLVAGDYTIDFKNNAGTPAPAYAGSYTSSWVQAGADNDRFARSCGLARKADPDFVRLGGVLKIDNQGNGEVTVKLPPTATLSKSAGAPYPTDAAAICVNKAVTNDSMGSDGNQAPIAII